MLIEAWLCIALSTVLALAAAHIFGSLHPCRGLYIGLLRRTWEANFHGFYKLGAPLNKCCRHASAALPLLYILTLLAAYHLYASHIFSLLLAAGVSNWHQWTGAASVGLCLISYLTASLSNPGIITADNHEFYLRLYMPGKEHPECWACHWQRPARSRHCTSCHRCIARFDHHCAWINNCVGLLNLRWFLLFLAANSGLCAYGALLAGAVLGGVMRSQGLWHATALDHRTGSLVLVRHRPRLLLPWLMRHHAPAVMLGLFLALAWAILTVFLTYHLWLAACGITTYETFHMPKVDEKASAGALAGDESRADQRSQRHRICPTFFHHQQSSAIDAQLKRQQGIWQNFAHVVFPLAFKE